MRRDRPGARAAMAAACAMGLFFLSSVAAVPLHAAEPVGDALLEAAWVEADTAADRRLLRLKIRPLVPLRGWTLRVTSPTTFDVRPQAHPTGIDFREEVADETSRAVRAGMPELQVEQTVILDFEILYPATGGGMVSFVAEDETDGRVLAAIGVTARAPGPRPVKRLGAAEFRANVVPAPEPR